MHKRVGETLLFFLTHEENMHIPKETTSEREAVRIYNNHYVMFGSRDEMAICFKDVITGVYSEGCDDPHGEYLLITVYGDVNVVADRIAEEFVKERVVRCSNVRNRDLIDFVFNGIPIMLIRHTEQCRAPGRFIVMALEKQVQTMIDTVKYLSIDDSIDAHICKEIKQFNNKTLMQLVPDPNYAKYLN